MLNKKFIFLLVFLITFSSISFISANDINKMNKEISLKKMDTNLLKAIREKENFENNNDKFGVTDYETSSKISVIILLNDSEDVKKFVAGLQKKDIKIPFTFHIINGFAAQMNAIQIYDIAIDSRIKKIYLDKKVNMSFDDLYNIKDFKKQNEITLNEIENLSESAIQIGAQELWDMGFKGKSIKIAVLDTGIDDSHPALQGKVIEKKDFTWWDDRLDSNDYVGHGTHVAGIISGYWKNNTSNKIIFSGIAPEAEIVNYKVLDDWGSGYYSSIIKAIEEAVDNNIDIISMSLGSSFGNPDDILSKVVDKAVENGAIVVVAAGNIGWYGLFTIDSPGTARSSITVGAVDKSGTLAYFSSVGPLINGEIKPDVTAPGVNILSTCANSGFIECNYTNGKYFVALSGTSMATPHVTGAVALLLSVNKNLTPIQIKDLLKNGASSKYYFPIIEGAGLIQINKSYQLIDDVIISPQSLYFGLIDNKEDKAINISFYNLGNINRNIVVKTSYYLYLETNNLTISSNGKIDTKLYLNTSSVEYVLDYPGFWLGFSYIDIGSRNISVSLGGIVPEKLNLSYFGYYSEYSKQKSFEEGDYDYNWYELNILNNTEFLDIYLYDDNYTWIDSILGVINPDMKVEYEEFAWWYDWDNGLYTNFWKYNPINGKWIFFTGTYDSNKENLILDVSHPSFSIDFDYIKGSYGDIVTHNESIENLIEYPLYSSITGIYDVLKNGKKITDSSQKITNAGSMLYFKINITNITKGFVLNFERKDNVSYWDCKGFYLFIFDPRGNLLNNYYWYYDWIYLCNSPYYSYNKNKWVYNTTQGEWSVILVPSYYSNADIEYDADVKLNVYDLVPDDKWTLEKTKSITIDSGERKDLLFETHIPDETEDIWHLDIFESTLSIINWNKARSIKVPIYIETLISNFLNINWPITGNYNYNKIYLSINSERNCLELDYKDLNENQEKVNILCKNCNSINKVISFKEGFHNLEIRCMTENGKIGKNKVLFFIDTKKPQISITNPKSDSFTNGSSFFVGYSEDNLKSISLLYENDEISKEDCPSGKNKNCEFNLDIHNYDGQSISYYFILNDIAGNFVQSKSVNVYVDTTLPKINEMFGFIRKNKVKIHLNVTEKNFKIVEYIDENNKKSNWKKLCSNFKNMCVKKIKFSGNSPNIKIRILDKAGNSIEKFLTF